MVSIVVDRIWPRIICCFLLLLTTTMFTKVRADWESWWTYEGISGPDFWGRLNPRWSHCSKGQRQSPIDIQTANILYDPLLDPIKINGDYIKGRLVNTGRGISLMVDHRTISSSGEKLVTFLNGPFSYQYTLSNITLHFGRENDRGSEHTIDGRRFPGELQLYAYNSQLYSNWSEAKREPNGLIAISIFILVAKQTISTGANAYGEYADGKESHHLHQQQPNAALKHITGLLKNITKRGLSYPIETLSIMDLLPTSWEHYVTYEGSLTQPACHETVQWVILNRPVYLNSYQFHMLRHSLKGDGHQDNFRPTQPPNKRSIRSNIVHQSSSTSFRQQQSSDSSKNENNNNYYYKMAQRKKSTESDEDQTGTEEDTISGQQRNKRDLNFVDDAEPVSGYSYDSAPPQTSSNGALSDSWSSPHLMAVKDPRLCSADQIRLYGYRAIRNGGGGGGPNWF